MRFEVNIENSDLEKNLECVSKDQEGILIDTEKTCREIEFLLKTKGLNSSVNYLGD